MITGLDTYPRRLPRRSRMLLVGLLLSLPLSVFAGVGSAQAANCVFDGSTDNQWNVADNWSGCGGVVPTAADDVTSLAGQNPSLTTGANGVANSISFGNTNNFRVGGGKTMTVGAGTSSIVISQLIVDGGATLRLNGTTNWSAGAWFTGDAGTPGTIENAGTLNLIGDVNSFSASAGLLHNLAGATVNRTTSAGTAVLGGSFDNDGAVTVASGTLALTGGSGSGNTSAGSFTTNAGTTLSFGGLHSLGASAAIAGAGTARFVSAGGGNITSLAAGAAYSPATTAIEGGFVDLAGNGTTGRITSNGSGGGRGGAGQLAVGSGASNFDEAVRFRGGGLTSFAAGGTTAITGTAGAQFIVEAGATLRLNGTTTWSGGTMFAGDGSPGTIENAGTLNVTGDVILTGNPAGLLHNLTGATLNRTTSVGTATFFSPFDNDGAVTVASGTLALTGGSGSGNTSAGSFTTNAGTTLSFGGLHSLGASAAIAGAGTARFVSAGGGNITSLAAGAAYSPATTAIEGGFVDLAGNGTTGRITSNGSGGGRGGAGQLAVGTGASSFNQITFAGGLTSFAPGGTTASVANQMIVEGGATLRLNGTTTWSGGTWFAGNTGAGTIENAGTLDITGDVNSGGDPAGLFHNLAGAALNRTTSIGLAILNSPFQNDGAVTVASGTLDIPLYTQTAGTTTVSHGAALGLAGAVVTLQGGVLRGDGIVIGDVNNTGGSVNPGSSPGRLVIDGNYAQGPAGTLTAEISGPAPITQFDVLAITGDAALDGTLAIVNDPGYDPQLGELFKVLTTRSAESSRSGSFSQLTGATVGTKTYEAQYNPDDVTLTVTAGSPPPTTPTITDSDPNSPSSNNNPVFNGTTDPNTTIRLYSNAACTTQIGQGSAAAFTSALEGTGVGLSAPVADNSTTQLRATATDAAANTSGCSAPFTYVEDSTAPTTPTITDSDPNSPSSNNNPVFNGTTDPNTTIRLYSNAACTTQIGQGSAAAFTSALEGTGVGLSAPVADNSTTQLRATATDAAANTSGCSAPFTYVEDSTIVPPASADLALLKTASAYRTNPGLDLTYTLAVTNQGSDEATGVVVKDPLPAGVDLVSTNASQGACNGTTLITCELGALANGATGEIEIVVSPTKKAGPTLTNTATVSAITGDPNKADNTSTVVTELGASKSVCRAITINGLGILGTKANETLIGSAKSDQIRGGGGTDKIRGNKGADCLLGQRGGDKIRGDRGKDVIRGGSGNDKIKGGSGADNIRAQNGKDKVSGGPGNDAIKARDGARDRIKCGPGADSVVGDLRDKISRNCEKVRIVRES